MSPNAILIPMLLITTIFGLVVINKGKVLSGVGFGLACWLLVEAILIGMITFGAFYYGDFADIKETERTLKQIAEVQERMYFKIEDEYTTFRWEHDNHWHKAGTQQVMSPNPYLEGKPKYYSRPYKFVINGIEYDSDPFAGRKRMMKEISERQK